MIQERAIFAESIRDGAGAYRGNRYVCERLDDQSRM